MVEFTPSEFYLGQNFPNPLKKKTTIKYCVAYKTDVEITVFDSEDKVIETLLKKEQEAGTYEVEFDGTDLSEGIYYCGIKAGNFTAVKKMFLMK